MIKVITHKDCLTTRSQRSKEKLQRPNSPKQGRGDRHSSRHNSRSNTYLYLRCWSSLKILKCIWRCEKFQYYRWRGLWRMKSNWLENCWRKKGWVEWVRKNRSSWIVLRCEYPRVRAVKKRKLIGWPLNLRNSVYNTQRNIVFF